MLMLTPDDTSDTIWRQPNAWLSNYRLVSLLDMLRFKAAKFVLISAQLQQLLHRLDLTERPLSETDVSDIDGRMIDLKTKFNEIDLKFSIKYVEHIQFYFSEHRKSGEQLTNREVFVFIRTLQERMWDELELSHFFYIPIEKIEFYEKSKEKFGQKVIDSLPGSLHDIEEAGKCYATQRNTACVFHLMRIMELAVQEFGNKLGVNLASERVWQVILDQINSEIKKMPHGSRAEKEIQGKYSACASHLFNVKVAWRNNVMHPRDKYTEEEATDIFNNVQAFIQYLAKEIIT